MAEVTCIVDTDGTTSPDYTSLAAAIAGETDPDLCKVVTAPDLVTNDEQLTIECRASDGTADTTAADVTGFTTDATRFVKITVHANHRHAGVWSDSKYRLVKDDLASDGGMVTATNAYTRLEKLQISVGGTNGGVRCINLTANTRADGCLLRYTGTGGVDHRGVNISGNSALVLNCVIYNFSRGGGRGVSSTPGFGSVGYAKGTTVYNSGAVAFEASHAGRLDTDNCIGVDSGTADFSNCVGDYNLGSDATAPGGNSIDNAVVKFSSDENLDAATKDVAKWVIFTSTTDFSLHSVNDGGELNDAIDAGEDLGASYNYDIIDTARPQGDAWDIGAFEYEAAGGGTKGGIMLMMDHFNGGTFHQVEG